MRLGAILLGLALGACSVDPHEALLDEQFDLLEEILDVMEGVTDEASSKEAAREIEALGEKLVDVQKRMSEMDYPTPEQRKRFQRLFEPREAELKRRLRGLDPKVMHYSELMDAFTKATEPAWN